VYGTQAAFAALRTTGRVVTWGNVDAPTAEVDSGLAANVVSLCATSSAFAAVKTDGTLLSWGDPSVDGYTNNFIGAECSGVRALYSTLFAFAAGVPSLSRTRCSYNIPTPAPPPPTVPVGGAVALAGTAILLGAIAFMAIPLLRGRGEKDRLLPSRHSVMPKTYETARSATTADMYAQSTYLSDSEVGEGGGLRNAGRALAGGEVVSFSDGAGPAGWDLTTCWSTAPPQVKSLSQSSKLRSPIDPEPPTHALSPPATLFSC